MTTSGGEGRDTITAGDGNDTINVSSMAADSLDVIDGGDGNADTLVVAAGAAMEFIVDDTRLANVENITVSQGASINLTGQTEAFAITGAGGAETIIGGNAVDTVLAGLGNDVLIGGIGADVLDGQAGVDTVSYADVTLATSHGLAGITGMTVDLTAGTGTYIGVAGATDTLRNIEAVIGSALNDVVVLGNGGMSASGEAGNDTITAGIGADTVDGGTGNDVILVTNLLQHGAGDIVTGGGGTDTIRYTAGDGGTLTLQAAVTGVEEVEISDAAGGNAGVTTESINASALTAGITLTGNDGANTLTGTAFADNFAAGGGNDTIVADGADTVDGGAGTDVMTLAADATFTDARLSNVETITLASDVDVTLDYRDTAAFQGGTGAVSSVTGVSGGAVENLNVVGSTGAFVQVNNIFTGMTTTNTVLNYQGGSDVEYVRATSAADVVNGGAGNDTIAGEAGADILTGEAGSDTFLFANTYSTTQFDTVTDFLIGAGAQSDVIGLSEVTIAGVQAQTNFGPAIVRTDGLTIQSYATTATGVVTLYDESTGTGTTEVFARTSADVLAIANALANQELNNETAIFRLDADANGVAESSVIVSQHARGLEIVQLTGVAAVDLNLTATAGDITVSQNNTLIGSDGVDTFFGMAGDDVITGNGGADVITGGLGADTINLGEAVAAADSLVLTTGLTADTVNGFDFGGTATDDDIQFDLSDLETANNVLAATTIDLVALDTAASVAAGAVTLQTVTGTESTAADTAAAAGANVFLLDRADNGATTGRFANAAAAVDEMEAGGDLALTFASNIAADDAFVFAYEIAGGGVGIAIANFAAADDNTGAAAATGAANLEVADLAVLVGVTDVTSLTAADFAFIA